MRLFIEIPVTLNAYLEYKSNYKQITKLNIGAPFQKMVFGAIHKRRHQSRGSGGLPKDDLS